MTLATGKEHSIDNWMRITISFVLLLFLSPSYPTINERSIKHNKLLGIHGQSLIVFVLCELKIPRILNSYVLNKTAILIEQWIQLELTICRNI